MTAAIVAFSKIPRRIDAIDRKILRVLQEDASLSVADIGERVGLSSTPAWKRIQRMENEGIISGRSEQDWPWAIGVRIRGER